MCTRSLDCIAWWTQQHKQPKNTKKQAKKPKTPAARRRLGSTQEREDVTIATPDGQTRTRRSGKSNCRSMPDLEVAPAKPKCDVQPFKRLYGNDSTDSDSIKACVDKTGLKADIIHDENSRCSSAEEWTKVLNRNTNQTFLKRLYCTKQELLRQCLKCNQWSNFLGAVKGLDNKYKKLVQDACGEFKYDATARDYRKKQSPDTMNI